MLSQIHLPNHVNWVNYKFSECPANSNSNNELILNNGTGNLSLDSINYDYNIISMLIFQEPYGRPDFYLLFCSTAEAREVSDAFFSKS